MSRRRFLPKYVTSFLDRHGKERLRFRRKGWPDYYFQTTFGTPEFGIEYRQCLDRKLEQPHKIERYPPGTFHDLIAKYYLSTRWTTAKRSEQTKAHDRRILEAFRAEHGHRLVAEMKFEHVEKILSRKADTPSAANKLRKQLRRILDYACQLEMISRNPTLGTEPMAVTGSGHHTWTEEEIARFQAKHPIGSKARLAFELLLWTGQRRSDIVRIGRQQISDGRIDIIQEKTKTALRLPIPQQLLEAIVATPNTGKFTLLVTEYGKPFTANGFGNRMRAWCDEAELPNCSSHGLRKALSRRLAEIGTGNQGIKSVTGHRTDAEVARYTRDADQERMAAEAIAKLSTWERERADVNRASRRS